MRSGLARLAEKLPADILDMAAEADQTENEFVACHQQCFIKIAL